MSSLTRGTNCNADDVRTDSPGTWLLLGILVLFPFGLAFLYMNDNVWCRSCGMRFKKRASLARNAPRR
jgi:hypothetical protein